MKRNIILIISLFSLLLSGCSLDRDYLMGPTSGTFPATREEAFAGLFATYKNLSAMDASSTPFPGIQDNCTDIGAGRINTANYTGQVRSQLTSQNALVGKLYKQIYKGAGRVHEVLDKMDQLEEILTQEEYYMIMAELLLVRDYYYELGCQMWGDIPFIDHSLGLDDWYYLRDPVDEVIDRILFEDLTDELFAYLPVRHSKEDYGTARLGRVGAYGIKARMALNWGYYELAAECAAKALELAQGEYALEPYDISFCGEDHTAGEPSVANLFGTPGHSKSDEWIWALQYNMVISGNQHNAGYYAAPRIVGGCSYFGPTQNLIDAFQCRDGKSISESPLYDYQNPWKNRDPRLDLFCVRPGSRVLGVEFQTAPNITQVRNYNTNTMIPNSEAAGSKSEYGANGSMGPAGYLWRKYIDRTEFDNNNGNFGTNSKCVLNYPLLRLAEIYLIQAEANIEMASGDLNLAKESINEIRRRAKMPEITTMDRDELRTALRYERMVELCNEGFRWFDIRRWGMAETVVDGPLYAPSAANNGPTSNAKPTFDENWHPVYSPGDTFDGAASINLRVFTQMTFNPAKDYLWPIPEAERIANPDIEQNPEY